MRRRLVSLAPRQTIGKLKSAIKNQKSPISGITNQKSKITEIKNRTDTSAPRVPQPILQWRSGSPIGNVVREEFSEKQPGY
jgi:hypothetical protein